MVQDNKTNHIEADVTALRNNMSEQGIGFSRTQIIVLITAAFVVVFGLVWLFMRDAGDRSIPIRVSPFTGANLNEGDRWKLVAAEQALIAYLEASGEIRIERTNMEDPLASQGFSKWAMTGSLTPDPENENLMLRVELKSLENKYVTFAADIPGTTENLSDMARRAAGQVFSWSGRDLLSKPQIILAEAELPVSNRALRYLSEGQAAYQARDDRRALKALMTAAELADRHPVIYLQLSRSWERLGYRAKALEALGIAYENRTMLTRQRQLEIEAQYYKLNNDWKNAQAAWVALTAFHPNNLNYWLGLTDAYLQGSELDEAERVINKMKDLPVPLRDDIRINLIEASYWYHKGHYEKGSAAARLAIDKARKSQNKALLGEALLQTVNFVSEDSKDFLQEAEDIFIEQGNDTKLAETYGELGKLRRIAGELQSAEELYLRAIDLAAKVGDEANIAELQIGLGIVYDLMGRMEASLLQKRDLASYYGERGIRGRHGIMLENIGISLFKLGRLDEAERSFEDARVVFEDVDDTIGIAWFPYHMSRIRSRGGILDEAERLAAEAIENSKENPEGDLEGNTGFELGHLAFFRGDFVVAGNQFRDTKTKYLEYENNIGAAEADLMLARILIRSQKYAEARAALDSALAVFDADTLPDYQLDARTVNVDLAFAMDDEELEAACDDLALHADGLEFQEFLLRAKTRLIRCDARFSDDAVSKAIGELVKIRKRAERLGLFEPYLHTYTTEAWIYKEAGLEAEQHAATQNARDLAAERGMSITGLVPVAQDGSVSPSPDRAEWN